MRVIAGVARGRRLKGPPGRITRPMTDRMRESIFSAIASELPGAKVLDLYAGTGSLGLEALSRGSSSAVFVERDRRALQVLRANLEAVGLGGIVVASDVDRFLETHAGRRVKGVHPSLFDLVFVDPPYRIPPASVELTLRKVVPQVRSGGTVVLHRPGGERPPAISDLPVSREHDYRTARVWRLRGARTGDESSPARG